MKAALYLIWHLAVCLRATLADASGYDGLPPPAEYSEALDNGTNGNYPVRTYATADDIVSPQVNYLQWNERCDDGLLYFLGPRGWSVASPGPMILDGRGDLVWTAHFDNEFGGQAYDFKVQTYQGEQYLTFWLGDDRVRGHGSGSYYMLNASYDIVRKVDAANGLSADLHEFLITDEGTALMTIYQIISHDVTEFREFAPEEEDTNYIWDSLFQELDLETGELLFQWRASDHLLINISYHGIGPGGTLDDPYDWFHINSIQKDELGNYLISARYSHSIHYINGRTGEIIWTYGGRLNDFMDLSDGFGINFAFQHDARFLPLDTFPNTYRPGPEKAGQTTKLLTYFDNTAEDQHYEWGMTYSRALLVELKYPTVESSSDGDEGGGMLEKRGQAKAVYTEQEANEAKVVEINGTDPKYTVRVIASFENPRLPRSSSQGSVQILPQAEDDPKVLVGYGLNAIWTEYSADGTVLCDAHFGAQTSWELGDIQSYRILKFAWTGRLETSPSADISDDDVEIYVSWNGATEVVDWIVQCSDTDTDDDRDWEDVVRMEKSGFETIIPLPEDISDSRYLRVIALGEAGRRLDYGVSETIDRGMIHSYFSGAYGTATALKTSVARVSTLRIFLILVSAASGFLVLFEVYRRYLSWRTGRPGGSALRWRKGGAYRLLSEAS